VTAALAVYGAVLSSFLGYLAWRREHQQVHFASKFVRGERGGRLEIVIVNTGHRPVSLAGAHFEYADGTGGYWPASDEETDLPCKLSEGDSLSIVVDETDLDPEVSVLVVQGYGQEFRHIFDTDSRRQWAERSA
jgi:hypothetical protein